MTPPMIETTDSTASQWQSHRVATFAGQHDTHIRTGEDYNTLSLADIFAMEPGRKEKGHGAAFIPSSYCDYNAREHAIQRQHGRFVALCGDVDSGDHDIEQIQSLVRSIFGDSACLIYSSAHSRPGDRRWRIILPLLQAVSFDDWHDAQEAFFAAMEDGGVKMDHAMSRAAQPVYLPNVPSMHAKSGTALRGDNDEPLYYQRAASELTAPGADIRSGQIADRMMKARRQRADDDQARARIRHEAEQRRAQRADGDGNSLIVDFNASNSLPTMLEICGYQQSPRNEEDWRSPNQTGETFATRIIGDKWVSLSASDAGCGVGEKCKSGCFGDAYDLFVHYKHRGDHKAAFRALHAERRAAQPNVIYPPAWVQEAPPYEEMPDWPEWDGEDSSCEIDEPPPAAPPRLPFFWFHDAQANLDANDFVEGLLTSSAMSVVYGPSNCGKTFFVVDLALHVAMGLEWRGREVDKGAVVYLSLEGAQGIRNRLAAFRTHHNLGSQQIPFVAMPQPVNLLNEDADVHAVIQLVNYVADQAGIHVAMVIVDTLSRAMAGGNENSPEDMTAIVGNCDRIRDATGAHVCIVHHSGKDEARGARGHSSLRAATDTEIEITREQGADVSNVRIAKQRDLEAADPFTFSLKGVSLGTNRRGKDVTSCVVLPGDKAAGKSLSRESVAKAFAMMVDAWTAGKPLSHKPQSRDTGRYAPLIFSRKLGGDATLWKAHIDDWIYNECVSFDLRDPKTKLHGLHVLSPIE